jgi:hypothetical protein
MGKASAPDPPDYRGAAEEQAKSSQEAANQQMYYNRPEQVTPFGSQLWSYGTTTDPTSGKEYTTSKQTSTIVPEAQRALNAQLNIQSGRSEFAQDMLGRVEEGTKDAFDFGQYGDYQGLQGQYDPQAPGEYRDEAFTNMQNMAGPQRAQDRARVETQLANQGITPGSEAYENAMRQLGDQESRQEMGFMTQAGAEGQRVQQMQGAEQGMDVTSASYANNLRQMQLAQGIQERNLPLNELNALLTGQQVSQPNMPGFKEAGRAADTQYMTAAENRGQAEMDIFNTQQASKDALMSGAMNMGSSMMMCDLRVKRNLEHVGYYDDGIPQYAFQYLWSDDWYFGPIAQEVELVHPELVGEINGIKFVNMRGIGHATN